MAGIIDAVLIMLGLFFAAVGGMGLLLVAPGIQFFIVGIGEVIAGWPMAGLPPA